MKGLIEVPRIFVEEHLRQYRQRRQARLAEGSDTSADVGGPDSSLMVSKRVDRRLAQEAEKERAANAAVRRKADRLTKRLRADPSKKPPKTPRKDPELDLMIFKRIRSALESGDAVRLASKPGPTVTDMRSRKKRIRTSNPIAGEDGEHDVIEIAGRGETTFLVPHWDHTGDRLKLLAWAMAIKEMGGEAMSLHIPDITWTKATKCPRGSAAYMRDRMVKRLRQVFSASGFPPPDFFFLVEASTTIRPHLHGAIVVPAGMRPLIETALVESVGVWRAGIRQLDLRQIDDASGWAAYVAKFTLTTMLVLEDKRIAAATNGLRSAARAWYELQRKTMDSLR